MSLRTELLKRIEKKQTEIREYHDRIREASAYVQGLQDTLKLIPKDNDFGDTQEVSLRHGSNIAKARDSLKAAGRAMHITEILKAIGQPTDKKHRIALGGSIAAYARRSAVFTKTAPNTFGLIEFDSAMYGLDAAVAFDGTDSSAGNMSVTLSSLGHLSDVNPTPIGTGIKSHGK